MMGQALAKAKDVGKACVFLGMNENKEIGEFLFNEDNTYMIIAEMLEIINKDRDAQMENYWIGMLKLNWDDTINELFDLYKALLECEPSNDDIFQSGNLEYKDDDGWARRKREKLDEPEGGGLAKWIKRDNPDWKESETTFQEMKERWTQTASDKAKRIINHIETLKGRKLGAFSRQLWKVQHGEMGNIPIPPEPIKPDELSDKDWGLIWKHYKAHKPIG